MSKPWFGSTILHEKQNKELRLFGTDTKSIPAVSIRHYKSVPQSMVNR